MLFKNNKTGQYVLAFRGTEITNLANAVTNFTQGVGLVGDVYRDAMTLAARVSQDLAENDRVSYGKLEVVGHSLGGGLATAAAIANGLSATVFNPAGLHTATLEAAFDHFWSDTPTGKKLTTAEEKTKYRESTKKLITVFAVKYEALTSLQDKPGLAGADHAEHVWHGLRPGAGRLVCGTRRECADRRHHAIGQANSTHFRIGHRWRREALDGNGPSCAWQKP